MPPLDPLEAEDALLLDADEAELLEALEELEPPAEVEVELDAVTITLPLDPPKKAPLKKPPPKPPKPPLPPITSTSGAPPPMKALSGGGGGSGIGAAG